MEPARTAARLAILVAFAALGALGCGGGRPRQLPLEGRSTAAPPKHEHLATIERIGCYGSCPVYKLTVYRDGAVEYEGEQYVKVEGKAAGELRPEEVTALEELFRKHRYLELKDSYEYEGYTHAASVYTAYTPAGGKRKDVRHYMGDISAPQRLVTIEEGIDAVVKIEQWIGTRAERDKLLGR
ncbi:MAG TPA: DUF6438 domain-containing protein [Kofleriaceae bacterium]|nr:DUF6438 domain-containing protein [Kofleriaceae bacterium]